MSFKNLVKKHIEETALNYLKLHIKSKGKELQYTEIKMKNYLLADSELTLQQKKEASKIRTRMTEVKCNRKNKYSNLNCVAGEKKSETNNETQQHVYKCKELFENKNDFDEMFENHYCTKEMKYIVIEFTKNMKLREKLIRKENES